MSSYGRNNGQGPQNNSQNRPSNNRKQITCRLCNRILHSTQALITHIESHIVQGDIAPNQYQQPNDNNNNNNYLALNPNNFRARPPLFPAGGVVQVPRPVPTRPMGSILSLTLEGESLERGAHSTADLSRRTPLLASPPAANRAGSSGSRRHGKRPRTIVEDVVSPIDGTRPFLSQLDRPIPKVVDLEIGNEEDLDLTLKL